MTWESIERLKTAAERNALAISEAKAAGRKVVGLYCLYSPAEIALAAGAVPVVLCGTRNDPIATAEQVLPRNLCPLIKSSFGFAMEGSCPYLSAADLVVADTTCDGKKKMFELLGEMKPVHLLHLPSTPGDEALPFWRGQLEGLVQRMESDFGVTITEQNLTDAITLANRERRALKALMDLPQMDPAPVTGMQMLEMLFKLGFFSDRETIIELAEGVVAEVQAAAKAGTLPERKGGPRILLTGVPVGMGSHKVVRLIEECGGQVVCMENCTGYKKADLVDETGDPLTALARRYLSTPCSVMAPNQGRFDLLEQLVADFRPHGVVDLTWQACHTYNVEAYKVRNFLRDRFDLPGLHIETDYSEADAEQLKVRIEAFLEMIA